MGKNKKLEYYIRMKTFTYIVLSMSVKGDVNLV